MNYAMSNLTIGTSLSEGTEEYGMKEMVYECEYLQSTYYEGGHSNNEFER
jgi:hypothetical protein